ncbi:putative Calmodulin-binding domain, plant [Helianthus annuus]|uniref:Calmodulin-binding domain, plant n=1 Tax=Helianthus annuus TaxID=4232 RepID=A0A9K3H4P8_HELAN|nr:putative Calmodulin-binding domain, plant [Helianthus annuus]KAJ0832770.1 putative Calmodulin-binding domain, plant [Helianthus annuus]
MNTLREEAVKDGGTQRRKSIGSSGGVGGGGGKTRRYSIGVTSARKSIGEEGSNVPNYLRASTGSCHDFCKFGKKHEHSKSTVPVKFKATRVVKKDGFTKTVVTLEKKKTTLKPSTDSESLTPDEHVKVTKKVVLLPSKKQNSSTNGKATKNELKAVQLSASVAKTSPVVVNRKGSNGGVKTVDVKTVKKTGVSPKTGGDKVKKVAPKATLNESQSPKASFRRAANLNTVKHKGVKQTKTLLGVAAEPEVKPETMEFDFIQPSLESINNPICDSSESFSGKNVVNEESVIKHPVHESSEIFSDKELLEESLAAPAVAESSQSCSDKEVLEEESLTAHPLSESSESFYDDEVLEEESEYTEDTDDDDDDNGEEVEDNSPRRLKFRRRVTEVTEDGQNIARRTYKNKTLDVRTDININGPRKLKFAKGKVTEGKEDKQRVSRRSFEKKYVEENKDSNNGPESVVLKHQGEQGKKDAQGLLNNVIEETASKLVESRKSKVKALVGAFETVISLQDGKPSST